MTVILYGIVTEQEMFQLVAYHIFHKPFLDLKHIPLYKQLLHSSNVTQVNHTHFNLTLSFIIDVPTSSESPGETMAAAAVIRWLENQL